MKYMNETHKQSRNKILMIHGKIVRTNQTRKIQTKTEKTNNMTTRTRVMSISMKISDESAQHSGSATLPPS